MKYHLLNLAQVLLGLLVGFMGLGAFMAVVLPLWLAEYVSAVMVAGLLFCLSAIIAVLLILAGMVVQRREHDARISRVLKLATEKASGRKSHG